MAKVLVVDDDRMNLRMAEFALKSGDYECVTALSGEEGIALIKTEKPDVVLLDVCMPDIDGFQTLEAIRMDPDIQDTRVIFLTGCVDETVESQAIHLGVQRIVEKPFKVPNLLDAIESVLG